MAVCDPGCAGRIRESLLSDELAGVLCKGLAQNQTVTHLDLSHNRIGDDAAQKLAHVLAQPDTVLIRLNLADNSLGPGAGAALAEVLRFNTVLQQLSLRLNAIAAPGAISLLKALKGNATLTSLNISCNGAYDIAPDLIELMHANRTLQSIDVSGNDAIAAKDSAALLDAVKSMSQLTDLDLRLNPRLQAEEDAEIRYQLNGRQERLDRARRVSYLTDRGSLE